MVSLEQANDWYKVMLDLNIEALGLKPRMTVQEYKEKYPDSHDFDWVK